MNHTNNEINTIFFDVGGVLSVDFIEIKVMDLAKKYNLEYEVLLKSKKKYRPLADLGQISDQEFWVRLLEDVDITATEDDWRIDPYVRAIHGVLDLAKDLKKTGYQIAILSNDSLELAEKRRQKFGFDDLFQEIILSCKLGMVKPEPEIYQFALKRLDIFPNQSILIDDRLENVRGAGRVGIHTILFQNIEQVVVDLVNFGIQFNNKQK